ncbi:hypothetical protein BDP27DRAFT_454806 [Rhodocollybia butyracea]|uniref:Uncharacterized protein n=1 Tax=Rhodocollybia butyracea TaxID=206335 RepID=A0A9P5PA53_9AGAR|nr:hypothetical protein BDP27DRAFT_454806 [Rhodocollybia butyracea]
MSQTGTSGMIILHKTGSFRNTRGICLHRPNESTLHIARIIYLPRNKAYKPTKEELDTSSEDDLSDNGRRRRKKKGGPPAGRLTSLPTVGPEKHGKKMKKRKKRKTIEKQSTLRSLLLSDTTVTTRLPSSGRQLSQQLTFLKLRFHPQRSGNRPPQ